MKTSSKYALLIVLSLLIAIPGSAMILAGFFELADYNRYQEADFIPTTCYILETIVLATTRNKMSAFYVDISVNYTVNNVVRERKIQFGAFEEEHEANAIANQLDSQGQVQCYYHPTDDFPLLKLPSLPYLYELSLGLVIPGFIMVAGGLALGIATCVLDRKQQMRCFKTMSRSTDCPALLSANASVELGCVKGEPETIRKA